MAIISAGYEGTVDEPQWVDLIANAGGRQYGVMDAASWKVTAGTADREIRIAVGSGFGYGVRDVSDTIVSLTLPAPSSGSRYDLIVAHRDWQANTTTFARVAGSATRQIPGREVDPGTVDDQPIALVRATAGQSQVTEIIDLRVWGGDGGSLAADELVLQYLNRLGTRVIINGVEWVRDFDSLGSPRWRRGTPQLQAGSGEGVLGGDVLLPNQAKALVAFNVPNPISPAAMFRVYGEVEIFLSDQPGDFAGYLQVRGPSGVMHQRRWHSHGRKVQFVYPGISMNHIVTQEFPANTPFSLVITSDAGSSAPVEFWYAYASWSIS